MSGIAINYKYDNYSKMPLMNAGRNKLSNVALELISRMSNYLINHIYVTDYESYIALQFACESNSQKSCV